MDAAKKSFHYPSLEISFSTVILNKIINRPPCAGVAELVDALDSGSSVRKDVRVQISPSAPKESKSLD